MGRITKAKIDRFGGKLSQMMHNAGIFDYELKVHSPGYIGSKLMFYTTQFQITFWCNDKRWCWDEVVDNDSFSQRRLVRRFTKALRNLIKEERNNET